MLLVSMQQIPRIRHLSLDLVEVVTRAVDWPAEKKDERFLPSRVQPTLRRLFFFLAPHRRVEIIGETGTLYSL